MLSKLEGVTLSTTAKHFKSKLTPLTQRKTFCALGNFPKLGGSVLHPVDKYTISGLNNDGGRFQLGSLNRQQLLFKKILHNFSTFSKSGHSGARKNHLNTLKLELKKSHTESVFPRIEIDKGTHEAIKNSLCKLYSKSKDPIFTKSFDIFQSEAKSGKASETYSWTLEAILAVYNLCANFRNLKDRNMVRLRPFSYPSNLS